MARFTIYSPTGTALYTGTPTYTGQYRKPGMLEFRDVGVPAYIDFSPGCYVGYESGGSIVPQYPRTGFGYKIYTVPQVKKQARSGSYGGSFVYQSIQLYDASKELEYCPFRDIVKGDNRIHFSTQPSISTFEGCDGLARRFEACLRDQYDVGGVQSWQVRTATAADGASRDLLDLMADAREFTVSGMNILECLDKIYDIWPEVGWIYTMETIGGRPTNTIIIGGAGLNPNQGTYAYGKGNGLKSLTRTVANADELANRIFAYGSQRNMTSDWYRSKNIKDAASVDIKHLMIPTSHWGETDGLPDAAKAFVDDGSSIARRGLRPRTAYFDGTEDLPEIYPTIEGMTIADVLGAAPDYVPNTTTIYRDPTHTRVDELADAEVFEDDGYSGSSGQSRLLSLHFDVPAVNATAVAGAESEEYSFDVFSNEINGRGIGVDIEATIDFEGVLTVQNATRVWTRLEITTGSGDELRVFAETEIVGTETEPGSGVWNVTGGQVSLGGHSFLLNEPITIFAKVFAALAPLEEVEPEETEEEEEEEPVVPISRDISISTEKGSGHIYETTHRKKTFHITLRQVGFDIAAQGDLGDGKVISMRSGKCQGRSFAIKDAILDIEHDTWDLECYRSEDESVGQWFPNAVYPVEEDDRFVLLDIAMPDSYINVAERRLYSAAQSLLSDTATERWQYMPEIDAMYMVENGRSIRAGENMTIVGVDIVEGEEGFVYLTESTGSNLQTTDGEDLILDGSGYQISVMVDTVVISEGESTIPTYKVTLLDRKRKVFTESKSVSEYTAKSVANARQIETSKIVSESSFFELCADNSVKLKDKYIGLWALGWMAAGGVAGEGEGPIPGGGGTFVNWGTEIYGHSVELYVAGVPKTLLVEGALTPLQNQVNSFTTTINNLNTLYNTISGWMDDVDEDLSRISQQLNAIDWFIDEEYTDGNVTRHRLKLNDSKYDGLYALGWISAGGVGSDSGGGGGGGESYLRNLLDVSLPTPPSKPGTGDLLSWNGSVWTNIPQSSVTPDLTLINSRLTTLESQVASLRSDVNAIDWFIPATVNIGGVDTLTLKLNPIYAGMWAEGWVASGGIGSGDSGGGSYTPGTGIDITNSVISIKTASTSVLGGVKVDGTTIIIDANGVISSVGGGGGGGGTVTSVKVGSTAYNPVNGVVSLPAYPTTLPASDVYSWAKASSKPSYSLSEISGVDDLQAIEELTATSGLLRKTGTNTWSLDTASYLTSHQSIYALTLAAGSFVAGDYTPNSASKTFNIPTTLDHISDGTTRKLANYLPLAGGTMTGNIVMNGVSIVPSSNNTGGVGSSSARFAGIYGVNGNLSGDLALSSSSHLDIGPVRVQFENNALHITKASSSDTNAYGLYADGFVSAGGVGASSVYEVATNKVTSLSSSSSDTQYPSAKCVYTIVGNVESLLAAI